jgi:hypothetical protein
VVIRGEDDRVTCAEVGGWLCSGSSGAGIGGVDHEERGSCHVGLE